jgi:O-methyltransferase involved in polyketide biosynthesis
MYRLDLPRELDRYELDRAELFAVKDPVLSGAASSCRRHTIAVDLAADWIAPLCEAGFALRQRTLRVAEGLMFYLAEPSVIALLRVAACGPRRTACSSPIS